MKNENDISIEWYQYPNGTIDGFRITRGVARYSTNYSWFKKLYYFMMRKLFWTHLIINRKNNGIKN